MLRNGLDFLMIPGPTTVPAEVLRAMHRPAIDIYEGPIIDTTEDCLRDLKTVFRTQTADTFLYIGNGHAAWDAALTNTLSRGDKVLVLESGHFPLSWAGAAQQLGIETEFLPGNFRAAVNPEQLRARLEADTTHAIKAVLMVQVDTASGVLNDVAAVRRAMDGANHPALLMVDLIASLACVPFEMDQWGVDVALAASQKGLMTPAGLAFLAASPKAKAASEKADLKTHFLDWGFRNSGLGYYRHCGTPPEQMLWAFRAALDMILKEGIEAVWRRHAVLAQTVRAAVTAWGEAGAIQFNIIEPSQRSNSVTTLLLDEATVPPLRDLLRTNLNVTIGGTIGAIAGKGIRIGHMGHVNAPMVLGTLASIEAGLKTLNVPIGKGAMDAAISVVSGALA
jgi:alanine-glyoxylate transaminase / serine-glyoxylate transaminase / serine-pyruvate transaminase